MPAFRVILLPGIVLSAEFAYGALIAALGSDVEAVAKDLEVYATPKPPADYSLDLEIAGVLREADAQDWQRFHGTFPPGPQERPAGDAGRAYAPQRHFSGTGGERPSRGPQS